MPRRIMIYGATGYSGKLIAREAALRWGNLSNPTPTMRVVLASRSASELWRLCREVELEGMELALDDKRTVTQALSGFSLVINAAGPFALTANRLAKCALEAHCHYVDINGETDVYRRLDDLGFIATQRGLALVCGAGEVSAASDFLLVKALTALKSAKGKPPPAQSGPPTELGAIRIAVPRTEVFSRGSAQTALRWTREQVPVARFSPEPALAQASPAPAPSAATTQASFPRIQYIPVGQLERSFDFGGNLGRRLCCAVALVDVMSAMRTARRMGFVAGTIEAYMAMKPLERWGYHWGAIASTWLNLPQATRWTEMVANQLPEGPSAAERRVNPHYVVLQIENVLGEPIIDWRLKTPNCYEFTARSVVAVAERLLNRDAPPAGWLTPGELLVDGALPDGTARDAVYPFAYCTLERRKVTRVAP